jgi:predicted protein tyrosine phosphatase
MTAPLSHAGLHKEKQRATLISSIDSSRLPPIMPPHTIYVAPLSLVETTIAELRVSHLVTLINGETPVPTPPSIDPDRHLRLAMNDICEPAAGLVLPCQEHVADLVQFALDWDRRAPLLIHCWAGISRSTAAAFISLCALNPKADEFGLARALRLASPTAYPNRRLVALGDEALARSGRMVAAVEEIGRGEFAEEGQVFALSALAAA